MSLSNAERQQRYRERLKSQAETASADTNFAEAIRARYRAGAMSALSDGLMGRDQNVIASARAVVEAIEGHLAAPADLMGAAERAGDAWARERWQEAYQSQQARQGTKGRRRA